MSAEAADLRARAGGGDPPAAPAAPAAPADSLLSRIGVGGRLLFAFLGISVFAVLAAAAGMIGFLAIGEALDRITEERVPAALSALSLSRQVERIVATAPAILSAESEEALDVVALEGEDKTAVTARLMAELRSGAEESETVVALTDAVERLGEGLGALLDVQRTRLQVRSQKDAILDQVSEVHNALQEVIGPWLLIVGEEIQNVRNELETAELSNEARSAALRQIDVANELLLSLQTAKVSASLFKDRVQDASAAVDDKELRVAKFRLGKLGQELDGLSAQFAPKLKALYHEQLDLLLAAGTGEDGILDVQRRELELLQSGAEVSASNVELSRRLQEIVDGLVQRSREDIDLARQETVRAQSVGSAVFIGAVALSLLCSVLVVWLYVGRRIVRRLRGLSDSMRAVAGGNLKVALPAAEGNDEIAEMTRALTVFRDTAVEVEENNLREIAAARQRLLDALESTSEGFAFYDAEDRLETYNNRYRELLYSSDDFVIEAGMTFEEIIRRAVEAGYVELGDVDVEGYIRERVAAHQNPGDPLLIQRAGGRWIQINERRVAGGGTVAVFSDLTDLKQREAALAEASERLQLALSIDVLGIWDAELQENRLWWSPEYTAMLGHDPETYRPTPPGSWEERLHPDDAPATKARMAEFLSGGTGEGDTMRLTQHMMRVDGSEMWVDSVMRAQRNEAGEATRLTGLSLDITERLENERRLTSANNLIMESLRYASRIQSAMLPARTAIATATNDHFLIWEPRDVVGGDFYWHHGVQGGYVLIVGDCTGHGVPGAFMTLIACGMLDRILHSHAAARPSRLLAELHRQLQILLGQDQGAGDTDDGLEAGICLVHEGEKRMVFSGARFSLWRAGNGSVEELKGDKAGIGYRRTPQDTRFTDLPIELGPETAYYLTTDGLIDQIGGPRSISFGKRRFSHFVAANQGRPMAEQAESLRRAFADYQGEQVRRDDVTVLGFSPLAV